MDYTDDIDDLIAVGDEELVENRKRRKKEERKTLIRNILIILLVIAVGVGVFFGVSAYNDYQRKQEILRAEASREEVTLQNINLEQVEWADQMCSLVNSWDFNQFDSYPEEEEPYNAKADIAKSLRSNAEIMNTNAEEISAVPFVAQQKAIEIIDGVTLTDNYRVVDNHMEKNTSRASQTVSAALTDYARSMEDMASDLDNISDYHFDGMRAGILRTGNFFDQMNEQLREELSSVLTLDIFDNAVTMERVASLESCNETMVDQDKLFAEYGDELREQKVVKDIVVQDRCESLLNNNELIADLPGATTSASTTVTTEETTAPAEEGETTEPVEEGETTTPVEEGETTTAPVEEGEATAAEGTNSAVEKNIRACERFLSTTVIDSTHPVHDKVIKTIDAETARPDLTVNDKKVEVSEDLEKSSNPIEENSVDDSETPEPSTANSGN